MGVAKWNGKEWVLPTQVTGRNVEEIVVFDALSIMDTNKHFSKTLDLSKYKKIEIVIQSNHDQPISVNYMYAGNTGAGNGTKVYDPSTDTWFTKSNDSIVTDTPHWYYATTKWNYLKEGKKQLGFEAYAGTAPTSGSLTVLIWGVIN